jgi:outer membrane immunogenic protein
MKTLNFTSITGVNTLRSFIVKRAIGVISLLAMASIAHAIGAPAELSSPVNHKGKRAPATVVAVARHTTTLPANWTGLYGGFKIGGVFSNVDLHASNLGFTHIDGTCNTNASFSSFYPGIELGYAHEYNSRVVLGLEGDFTYNTDQTGSFGCTCPTNPGVTDRFSFQNQMQASIRARLGYALQNHLLPFVTAGGSFAHLGLKYSNERGDSYSNNPTQAGWLVGAGLEWKFSQAWSLRAEYFYTAYGHVNFKIPSVYGLLDPNGYAHAKVNTNNISVAMNYWF